MPPHASAATQLQRVKHVRRHVQAELLIDLQDGMNCQLLAALIGWTGFRARAAHTYRRRQTFHPEKYDAKATRPADFMGYPAQLHQFTMERSTHF